MDHDLRRALRIGVILGLWLAGAYLAYDTIASYVQYGGVGKDAHAYWLTAHGGKMYGIPPGSKDAYLYSPAFAQVVRPFAMLPFAWFAGLCIALDAAAFVWLLAPLGWRWAAPLMLFMIPELMPAQVTGIITAAVVLAATGRGGWAAVGWLTKITPGGLSMGWLVSQRDWRGLANAVGWTAAISLISFALWPSAWVDWFHFLTHTSSSSPWTPVRGALALALVVVGGWRGWWWVLPVALVISAPVFGGLYVLTVLTGLARLSPKRREQLAAAGSPADAALVASA